MDVRTGFAPVNGTALYYEESGSGFPLVLAHGGIADHRMWDEQFPVFAQHYRAIRYDLRGFGQSRLVPGSFTHHEDLAGLLRCLGIERAFLVGNVLGATTIIDFAIAYPSVPAAIVTAAASLSGYRYQGAPPPHWREMEAAASAGDFATAADLKTRIWLNTHARAPEEIDADLYARVAALCRDTYQVNWDEYHPCPLDPPAVGRLNELRAPLLALAGERDDPNIAAIAGLLAANAPNAQSMILPGAARLPHMERPAEFNHVVLEFLERIVHND